MDNGHERKDLDVRAVAAFAAGLVTFGVLVHLALGALFGAFARIEDRLDAAPPPIGERHPLPPEPRLQADPRADLEALRTREERLLGTYGWVDRKAGVVRIPIDRAMDLVIERYGR
jgi:hypothetical protein